MPYSGGVFTLSDSVRSGSSICQDQKAAGVKVNASLMDAIHNDIVGGLNTALLKDGTNEPTANLPMGTYKHTAVGNGTARNQYSAVGQIQDGALISATTGGSANAQTLTLSPAITAYTTRAKFHFIAGYTNTGATTLNINGVGATNIFSNKTGSALAGNEIIANRAYEVIYDGTQFLLLNPSEEWQSWTPTLSLNSGSLTNSSVTGAKYRRVGKKIEFYAQLVYTAFTGSPSQFRFTLPVTAANTYGSFSGVPKSTLGARIVASGVFASTTIGAVEHLQEESVSFPGTYDNSLFPPYTVNVSGFYEI